MPVHATVDVFQPMEFKPLSCHVAEEEGLDLGEAEDVAAGRRDFY